MKSQVQRIDVGTGVHTAEWLVSTRAGQELLANCHKSARRPRCVCVPGGVEMYVGRRGGLYYLSRMPGTGFLHADHCCSVENRSFFSGACAYMPGVILEKEDGSLSIAANLEIRERMEEPVAQVSIDGVLDILMEQAALNQVSPGTDHRTWLTVRDRVLEAATWIRLGNHPLTDFLFVPDRYSRDTGMSSVPECESFLKAQAGHALIFAPFKELRLTTYSWQLVLKHLPRLRLWVAKEIAKEIEERCGTPYFSAPPTYALCLVAAKPGRRDGNYTVSNLACLPTDANYFPCRNEREAAVARQLIDEGKSLLRPLRFDSDPTHPLADFAILSNGMVDPVFVLSPSGNDELDSAKRSLASLMQRNHSRVLVFKE
ncbi:DUF1173 family protein [Sulfuricystis multivorans]|uniref:DUF1173 family protein n=1 Tax=Sulfuricystis multivorans TaxID=2211108 RepID=UPI000F825BD0|nr:DUF1173 family protein [Sulfuricystis multivorans]